MSTTARWAVSIWIIAILASAVLIARTRLSTDMSAFLPRSPSPAQQVLVEQVRDGVVSRLILMGIEGAPPAALAELSKGLTQRLRAEPEFVLVNNGEDTGLGKDRDFLWRHRYLLSPDVTPERFTVAGLRQSLETDLQLLGSELSPLVKRSLPSDPTGEILALANALSGEKRPAIQDGVWFSNDRKRAVLLIETRAAGFDIDAQQRDLTQIDHAFEAARRAVSGGADARLLKTGPAVFAVNTRARMEQDATRFSMIATILVAGLLLTAYRSVRVLVLGLLPVMSGVLAGFAAVSLGFGFVHGITLGFGVTLIGEAVDYAIYLFTQTGPGIAAETTLSRIWPTLRLGMTTSVCGFSAMLFSSFTGFEQLGLFSIVGLIAALAVTRWVLPALLPSRFNGVSSNLFAAPVMLIIRHAPRLLLPLLLLVLASVAALCLHHGGFWEQDLSSLSPIPVAAQTLDRQLRRDINAPDVRYLLVVTAPDQQQALTASERLSTLLSPLVLHGALSGFDAPSRYLPSDATQRLREAAIPDPDILRERLTQALAGLPFRSDLFEPFLASAAAAKKAPLLTRQSLAGTALRLKLDSLLLARNGQWIAMLPLRGVNRPERIATAIAGLKDNTVTFVDLKAESDRLLATYLHEAISLALIGSLVIVALLIASLRSPRRVAAVLAPLAAAVIVTAAVLTFGSQKLSIFNLVGLLLSVAVGSNYCLFFDRQESDGVQYERMVTSLVLANICTIIGFGVLSFSGIPVLHGIGMTVAVGAALSLIFSAVLTTWAKREQAKP